MKLKKDLTLPTPETIRNIPDVVRQLRAITDELQRNHKDLYDTIAGKVMAETPLFRFVENSDGDLVIQKMTSGTWTDTGWVHKGS